MQDLALREGVTVWVGEIAGRAEQDALGSNSVLVPPHQPNQEGPEPPASLALCAHRTVPIMRKEIMHLSKLTLTSRFGKVSALPSCLHITP